MLAACVAWQSTAYAHGGGTPRLTGEAANKVCVDWLEHVRIPEARRRMDQFPHELSGGMRQRVMVAIAMLC